MRCECLAGIGPAGRDIAQELVSAIAAASRGQGTTTCRGVIITTSTVTAGVASEAIRASRQIIDRGGIGAIEHGCQAFDVQPRYARSCSPPNRSARNVLFSAATSRSRKGIGTGVETKHGPLRPVFA